VLALDPHAPSAYLRVMRFSPVPLGLFVLSLACGPSPAKLQAPNEAPAAMGSGSASEQAAGTPAEATEFLLDVNREMKELVTNVQRMSWVKSTYITHDTEILAAKATETLLEYLMRKIKESRRFDGLTLPADTARQLYLLTYSAGLPAPADPAERAELARLSSEMESLYGTGKYCSAKLRGKGDDPKAECLTLAELSELLGKEKDAALLQEVWTGWHSIAPPIRPLYQRFVELGNKGAHELGFRDMGEIWRGAYDMPEAEFRAEAERLWKEVYPLYQELHCYTRARLRKRYGDAAIGPHAPIPAHLLGNMWAQEWTNLYPMLEPYPGIAPIDLTPRLVAAKYDAIKMVKLGESFFTSLGLDPLPKTFWERSLFTKPRDREVECHASAWDVSMDGDLRIKMCIRINHEDLVTIHHELGHEYYFQYYKHLPALYQNGANDGFHEGIGDTLVLSVTPEYLAKVGLVPERELVRPKAGDKAGTVVDKGGLNLLMQRALDGVAFLPFGKLVDEWRWRVFKGDVTPANYNSAWWQLRLAYQGVAPPTPRSEKDFDPGAKYHVPANVPYTRYFLARILQYQFHRALCKVAGHTGPLYTCSIYGNRAAGDRLKQMLSLGASRPWRDALAVLSGETEMDATAILDYYAPLLTWLKAQNQGQQCGWQ
jgi:peptidyl-dipeptidase A